MRRVTASRTVGTPYMAIVRPTVATPLLVQPLLKEIPMYHMHRFQKRMIPCSADGCLLCDPHRVPMEYRCIFPAFDFDTQAVVIVDLPGSQTESVQGIVDSANGDAPALRIRRTKCENGPITVSPCRAPGIFLGNCWDLAAFEERVERLLEPNTLHAFESLRWAEKSTS
jgi:hypothetical protein